MPTKTKTTIALNGNQLKIIALIAMTCDHVGLQLLPQREWLRMIGRLSFPIFAYMIGEGCRYTKHRARYLGTMAGMGFLCQLVYFFAMGSLYQCVLVTFTLSILMIYALDAAVKKQDAPSWILAALVVGMVCFVCLGLPRLLLGTDFAVDYGIFGTLLPVAVYLGRSREEKMTRMGAVMVLLSINYGGIQWLCLLSLALLALYDGKRGSRKLKNLFYIYYPLHLIVIWAISLLI